MPSDRTPEQIKQIKDQKPSHGGHYRQGQEAPNLKPKHLWLTIQHNNRSYRYILERLQSKEGRETWKVIARNGYMVLSNNRPVLIKHKLKHRRPEWKREEGRTMNDRSFFEKLLEAIEQFVERNPGI